jgi:fatty acid desaturase
MIGELVAASTVSLLGLAGFFMVTFKAVGEISLSWWVVLGPFWVPVLVVALWLLWVVFGPVRTAPPTDGETAPEDTSQFSDGT